MNWTLLVAQTGAAHTLFSQRWWEGLVATVIYAVVGMLLFGVVIKLMAHLTPFSVRKEIEDDQNVALGIVMGALIVGIAIIFAASIVG